MSRLDLLSRDELLEELAQLRRASGPALADTDSMAAVLHELQVHQVQLEMQNRELLEAQATLEESRSRYAELFDLAPVGYCTLDRSGILMEINLTGATLLRTERQHLLGKPFWVVVGAKQADVQKHLQQCCERLVQSSVEIATRDRAGRPRQLQLTSNPFFGPGGRAVGCRVTLIDATETRRREQADRKLLRAGEASANAEALLRAKDEFLAVVSHELRTPMAAQMLWVQVLRRSEPNEPEFVSALTAIEQCARAQSRLVQDLLDSSRNRTGKLRLEATQLDAAEALRQAVEVLRPAAAHKEVSVTAEEPGGEAILLTADPARLQQILGNLLANALEHTPAGGRVTARLRAGDAGIEFEVEDTGAGILPELLPHIFEPFRQADSSQQRTRGGLGLGLSIVRDLVNLHGGTVRAESAGAGHGSIFRVLFPQRPAPALESQTAGKAARQSELLEGLRVLVVEDEHRTRDGLLALLRKCGGLPVGAASAQEALDCLRRAQPDVVLSDLAMPGFDGVALLRAIRKLPAQEGGEVPAVALSAQVTDLQRQRALDAGYELFLAKPVELGVLVNALLSAGRRRAAS